MAESNGLPKLIVAGRCSFYDTKRLCSRCVRISIWMSARVWNHILKVFIFRMRVTSGADHIYKKNAKVFCCHVPYSSLWSFTVVEYPNLILLFLLYICTHIFIKIYSPYALNIYFYSWIFDNWINSAYSKLLHGFAVKHTMQFTYPQYITRLQGHKQKKTVFST